MIHGYSRFNERNNFKEIQNMISQQDARRSRRSERSSISRGGSMMRDDSVLSMLSMQVTESGAGDMVSQEKFEVFINCLIVCNFLNSIVEAETNDPEITRISDTLDDVFCWIFFVELILNMGTNTCAKFWNDSWYDR
eukprot:UN00336